MKTAQQDPVLDLQHTFVAMRATRLVGRWVVGVRGQWQKLSPEDSPRRRIAFGVAWQSTTWVKDSLIRPSCQR